jgi:nucleoside-diphosphate-sugar epimerase
MWLVTGGAGFIGSHIVNRLVSDGERVRVIDNLASGNASNLAGVHGEIEFIEGDIRDQAVVRQAMSGIDYVLHHAAQPSVPLSVADPGMTYAVNVGGTMSLLSAAMESGIRRFVFASTSAVYGDDPTSPKSEYLMPKPISPYASSKLAGEQLCAVYQNCYGLECISLRYFNVYGPGQDPNSAYAALIPKVLDLLNRGERPIIFGDGEQTRDFIYVNDVVDANIRAARSTTGSGGVFNIASGRPTSLNQIVSVLSSLMGVAPGADLQAERPGDIRHSLADVSRAALDLGFVAETTLEAGLAATVESLSVATAA